MSETNYDVFLSCKSEDYSKAEPIYHWLVANGHRPFFAHISLKISQIHGESVVFGDEVDEALDEADNMIVFTSNAEYVKKGYVKDEWRTFVEEQRTGRKSGMLVTILDGVRIEELPIRLRSVQSFNLSNYKDGILRFLGGNSHIEKKGIDHEQIVSVRKAEEEQNRREEDWAKAKMFTVGGVPFKMIRVEGGRGSGKTFYIGETLVTQELWEVIMNNNPSNFKGKNHPVECVTWYDCQDFIKELNESTNKTFRLPKESEWEYVSKGGNRSRGYVYAGSNNINDVAWYDKNAYFCGSKNPDYGTHDVKTKLPNELGVYDMSGNVWEWCDDMYGSTESRRVIMGGSWYDNASSCRVDSRSIIFPGKGFNLIGFRLALDCK